MAQGEDSSQNSPILNEIKRLVSRRGQLKACLTRFANFVNSPEPDHIALKLRLSKLDATWTEFEEVQSRLEELDSNRERERESFENDYYSLAAKAIRIVESCERTLQDSNKNVNVQHHSNQGINAAKLQPISLPQFSGSYEGWLQFFEIFKALVDKNAELSKIQKFYHLQSCLRGEALQVLQSMEICEDNYDEALKLLRERYENKRILINNHVRNLFETQVVIKDSHHSLRKLIDNVIRNLRALKTLNQPVESWDTLLIYLISQKLDTVTRKEWEVFNKKDSPTLDEFLAFLKNKCQVLETIDSKNQNTSKNTSPSTSQSSHRIVTHVSAAENSGNVKKFISANNNNDTSQNTLYCSFCNMKDHLTYRCPQLLALSCKERYFAVKRLGICTNCLKRGHNVENCASRNCKFCNKKHNSALHDFNFVPQNTPSSDNAANDRSRPSYKPNLQNDSCNLAIKNERQYIAISQNHDEVKNIGNSARSNMIDTSPAEPAVPGVNACSLSCTTNDVVELERSVNLSSCSEGMIKHASQILLATAVVYVLDSFNTPIKCRALLDSASQSNFCSKQLFQKLALSEQKINLPVFGINNVSCDISAKCCTKLKSLNCSFQCNVEFLVVENITVKLPQVSFNPSDLYIPSNIELADPEFYESQDIDILLGTELFFRCLSSEKIDLGRDKPILQNTELGWILAGNLFYQPNTSKDSGVTCFLSVDNNSNKTLQNTIQKFWQIETIENKKDKLTNEELECELHFRNNVRVDETGRYIVKLPLKDNYMELGDSYTTALKCLESLERRLDKSPEVRQRYTEFLDEYEALGHMTRIDPNLDSPDDLCVYLSHHAVFKENSSTTKLRVVFNASAKTSTGISLNDVLRIGPKVQKDVFDIVLKMRVFPILIVADIEKMYRMILIDESQRKLQRILWRDQSTKRIAHFQLNTITYGTASASFLATRVLHEIGLRHKDSHPEASKIIMNNFYMDDLIFGHYDIESAITLKNQISEILAKAGLVLRKWMSNDARVLENTIEPKELPQSYRIRGEVEGKALGTKWNSSHDTIGYTFSLKIDNEAITKRSILAGIGQLFDILGLINPVIVKAKLILQKVWKSQLDWDVPVPKTIANDWCDFVDKLQYLNELNIPRCVVSIHSHTESVIICGFSDASQESYGACIYLISRDHIGNVISHLICSKSRLAPLSSTSLPRLELCGALLLAQLFDRVIHTLECEVSKVFLFTDSTIVLDWLSAEPSKWKVFIANRVAEIQRITDGITWLHIDTHNNPADIVSRGCDPESLEKQPLWWYGPSFLIQEPENWPSLRKVRISVNDVRKENINLSFSVTKERNIEVFNEIFLRWSSYNKLLRAVAFIFRFYNNSRNISKINGDLSYAELENALRKLCKLVQFEVFSNEIDDLRNNKPLNRNSRILNLNPFLDKDDVLRVGGRLVNSNLNFESKHQIILPHKHPFVTLLINHYHLKYLHAGPQLILTQIRDKFWIVTGRKCVRSVLRKCIVCFRVKPQSIDQLMGSLPPERVKPSRPFSICGTDYAGPYLLKDGKTRSRVLLKAYICIFVCFSTRAVHVELVTDLSSEAFLCAFKRFVSRRGLPTHIFSDNATNFVGSDNELQKLCQVVRDTVNDKYKSYFSEHRIHWRFIPARSPHHGGIWESAVRSFKYHIKRIIGDNHLNFESFYTLLTQIEAILNSRPLLPLTNDPSDLEALTPGHFLIGESLIAVPQQEVINPPANRLKYFHQLSHLVQRFWILWSKDYLNTLQQRSKWRFKQSNIHVGTLVLLKEDNEAPMHWPLGRVVAVHPGNDNLVRVVSVRAKSGVFKRAVSRICPLPIDSSDCE